MEVICKISLHHMVNQMGGQFLKPDGDLGHIPAEDLVGVDFNGTLKWNEYLVSFEMDWQGFKMVDDVLYKDIYVPAGLPAGWPVEVALPNGGTTILKFSPLLGKNDCSVHTSVNDWDVLYHLIRKKEKAEAGPSKPTVWFSFDIEADGPGPISNSMLSAGIVVLNKRGQVLEKFEVNIEARFDAQQDPDTMNWWKTQQEAWDYCHQNTVSPLDAMWQVGRLYDNWSEGHQVKWVAQPACFDWMFLNSYYTAFASIGNPDIGYSCTCFSSLRKTWLKALDMTTKEYKAVRAEWMAEFHPDEELVEDSHRAVDDALFQGVEFLMLRSKMET